MHEFYELSDLPLHKKIHITHKLVTQFKNCSNPKTFIIEALKAYGSCFNREKLLSCQSKKSIKDGNLLQYVM